MKYFLLLALCLLGMSTYAQNTFPSSGNVAIGTAPASDVPLLVNGLIRGISGGLQIQNPGSAPNGSWITLTSPRSAPGLALAEGDGNGNIARRWDTYVKGGAYHIADNNFSTTQSRLTITTAGNVGIGIATPSNLLEVNGVIRSKEILVESANWPDYVFEKDYKMKSLAEIEAFIKENKHLPGIPNKTEVAENGVHLGEMNRKLLEKVEELTLHLIEKDKVISEQKRLLTEVCQRLLKLENK
ncbi:hypothetical protein RYH73_06460 [Olivibacter sp. CPCC 100613]|uniref:hypothetical protein n=1 Tax=Olivibacter sp. CPCC 100613 TaxID=3079931 RepID=UPI002FFD48B6